MSIYLSESEFGEDEAAAAQGPEPGAAFGGSAAAPKSPGLPPTPPPLFTPTKTASSAASASGGPAAPFSTPFPEGPAADAEDGDAVEMGESPAPAAAVVGEAVLALAEDEAEAWVPSARAVTPLKAPLTPPESPEAAVGAAVAVVAAATAATAAAGRSGSTPVAHATRVATSLVQAHAVGVRRGGGTLTTAEASAAAASADLEAARADLAAALEVRR